MKLEDIDRVAQLAFDLKKLNEAKADLDHSDCAGEIMMTRGREWCFTMAPADVHEILNLKIERIETELAKLGVEFTASAR